ncbi:low molecular weight phosphatase family protein [Knoellia sp. LjRoot47]|uniref:arsenate reductase/protein-tyrosine-phosphatase family protein n=1 Tax=Knoellia sp. LjRoot47 TaxID=3342330 RepID=UPI003ECC4D23
MTFESDHQTTNGRILVVCTGNICRSPYIERVLAHELSGTGIAVSSAGTGALVGSPVDPESARRLVAVGANAEGFAARQITREIVAASDLVIGATREHLSEVVPLHPRALRYSFALHDLGDLLAAVTPEEIAAAPGHNRVAKVAAAAISKRGIVHPRLPEQSGIVDPFRRDPEVFDQMVTEISSSLPAVVAALRG